MRNDFEWLKDILDEIEFIQKYSVQGEDAFQENELIQTWMVHHLQIIGEAASKISEKFRTENPSIRWREITSLRNFIVHQYFGIDLEEIWNTIVTDIPILKRQIQEIISKKS
ncbi:MAG: DUF86 domain-containing protein [Syntrophothermus sp.]